MQGEGKLSHLDARGRARMVDVGDKQVSSREATACGEVRMKPETLRVITSGTAKKGDVFATARIAGIQAAKRTHELVPLCHPLPLSAISVELTADRKRPLVHIEATVRVEARTGVEMEALTAVSVAALTVYDMLKAIDRGMVIGRIRLRRKSGGRSGVWTGR